MTARADRGAVALTRLTLHVNGREHELDVDEATPLIYVLRNRLGLTGTKLGCGLEQCGACAVLVDGESTMSCVRRAAEFQGKAIRTIESLAQDSPLSPVQQALCEHSAGQCGYCIPGIAVALTALWESDPQATSDDVATALQPHLCRCGSHNRILRASQKLFQQRSNA